MNRIRTLFIPLLLVGLLIITVLAPPAISKTKDRMLLGKVVTQKLTDTKAYARSKLSIEEKFDLIGGYIAGENNIVMVSQDQPTYDREKEQRVADLAMKEIGKLERIGIFPKLEISRTQNMDLAVKSYTEIDHPAMNTEVWELHFFSDTQILSLLMDSDTNLILQIHLWTKTPMDFVPPKETPDLFAKYLGIDRKTLELYKTTDTKHYAFANRENLYHFILVDEETSYGILIEPAIIKK